MESNIEFEAKKLKYLIQIKRELDNKIPELNRDLENKKKELAFINKWIESIPKCEYCKGSGSFINIQAQDEVYTEKCSYCNGTGLRN